MEERTDPGSGMWFASAGALTTMAVLAFPAVGAIDAVLAAAPIPRSLEHFTGGRHVI